MLPVLVVLSMVHLEGDVTVDGGDFVDVPFTVPEGTREIRIAHTDNDDVVILDFGVWSPDGFRGWGGGNTEDAIIGVDESSRSYRIGPITPGTWTVVVGKAKLGAAGGRYAIDIVCDDTPTLTPRPRAAFDPVVLSTERRWYRGDFHVHSTESGDATATFDQIAQLAMQQGLDFVNLSEHNTDAQLGLQAAAQQNLPSLLLLRGAEITTYAGHGNAIGLGGYVDHRVGYMGRTITNIIDDVTAQDALFIVNHPSLDLGANCIGCAWEHADTPWAQVAGMELITGPWDVVEPLFVPGAIELWDQLHAEGFRIAAVGGSDDHRAGMGMGFSDGRIGSPTTLVLADNLSEAAILDAVRKGRTMVALRGPEDPALTVHVITATGDLAEIGDDIDGIATLRMPLTITGGAGNFVQLYRDGEKLAQVEITSDEFTHTFEDEPGAQDRRYRVEIINNANQRIVVTSHFFVHGIAAEGGCGCSSNSPSGFALVVIALFSARRRWATRRSRPSTPS